MELKDLNEYKWKNRLLLVYSASETETDKVLKQSLMFDHKSSENEERDLLLINFKKTKIKFIQDQIADKKFLVLLVGKDGGVKNIFNEPVQLSKIYDLIDSMPMRIGEMN